MTTPFETYGAEPNRRDLAALTPEQVFHLRKQGVSVIAEAAGRTPGVVQPMPGGLPAVYAHIQRLVGENTWAELLAAVVYEESKGDQQAVSPTGALGPLQLTKYIYGPDSDGGLINPFRWRDSLNRAFLILEGYWSRAFVNGGRPEGASPLEFALAAYKEGWRGAWRPETQQRGKDYADRVMRHFRKLGDPDQWPLR